MPSTDLFSLGAGAAVLKPVINIGFGDMAVLREFMCDLFDLLFAWSASALLEDPFKDLQLHWGRGPPLPRCYFVAPRRY